MQLNGRKVYSSTMLCYEKQVHNLAQDAVQAIILLPWPRPEEDHIDGEHFHGRHSVQCAVYAICSIRSYVIITVGKKFVPASKGPRRTGLPRTVLVLKVLSWTK